MTAYKSNGQGEEGERTNPLAYRQTQSRNSRFRGALLRKPTPEELVVKTFLESRDIKFIFQKGLLKPFHRIVDFYIPGSKSNRLIIEIDGGYHSEESTMRKDSNKDRTALVDRNMRTLRITNEQVKSGEFQSIILRNLNLCQTH